MIIVKRYAKTLFKRELLKVNGLFGDQLKKRNLCLFSSTDITKIIRSRDKVINLYNTHNFLKFSKNAVSFTVWVCRAAENNYIWTAKIVLFNLKFSAEFN